MLIGQKLASGRGLLKLPAMTESATEGNTLETIQLLIESTGQLLLAY
jgi:hypothetical protein